MYSNRWLMVEIFITIFTVIGFFSFEFSGEHGGLSRVFSAHKQHSWRCPHVSSLVCSEEWPMVEGFSTFIGFLMGCELPTDCGDVTCRERLFYIHYARLYMFILHPPVFLHYAQLYIFILHSTVCNSLDELLDLMIEIFLHLYDTLKVSHVCEFSHVSLAETFS